MCASDLHIYSIEQNRNPILILNIQATYSTSQFEAMPIYFLAPTGSRGCSNIHWSEGASLVPCVISASLQHMHDSCRQMRVRLVGLTAASVAAPAVTVLVEWILFWRWIRFRKTFGKTYSPNCVRWIKEWNIYNVLPFFFSLLIC
jgi:hypothetical protein